MHRQFKQRCGAALALGALLLSAQAPAQNYPAKPVRLVLGTAPGGGFDITARIIATPLSELFGQQVVIDNRPGAGGGIAATLVANAPADGYTLMMGTVFSHGINPALYQKLAYDHIKDFAPVSMVASVPNVLAVHSSVPANHVAEFISYAKANPGKVLYGSAGVGSSLHLSIELLKSLAGINIVHVPYKGSALFIPDLLSGQILAICSNIPSLLPYIAAKRIRPLAVTSAKPTPRLPGLPTMMESGVPMEVIVWYAIFAPAHTPKPVLARLHADLGKVLNNPEVRKRLDEQGVDARPSTPDDLAARGQGFRSHGQLSEVN